MIKKQILAVLLFALSWGGVHADEITELFAGEIKILQVKDIKRIAVGNASLVSTSLLTNGQLLLIGEAPGNTNIHIWFNDGTEDDITIRIKEGYGTLAHKADEVRSLLQDVKGLNVRVVGERIVLSGRIDRTYEDAIGTVSGAFPELMDLTRKLDPAQYDVLELPANKMVFMNIKITEFNKNYLENLGIQWDNPISGPSAAYALDLVDNDVFRVQSQAPSLGGLEPGDASTPLGYFGIATEISSRINFAVNSGNALILAEPRLATRSGGEASFLAGGEVPLQTTNQLGASNVTFKEFGISLGVKPEVDQNNNIRATVTTEVSAVDNSVAVQGIPGFLTRKTTTDISMHSGETLVISGLINQQASKDINRLKFLSDIPILGELFKSKTFRDQKSELVIFVTPTVFDAESDLNQREINRRREGIQDALDAIDEDRLEIID
ncbi:MAG: pilus assembly protein N-terminal domain-containing protein [Gammaproteobacteria bacterium]